MENVTEVPIKRRNNMWELILRSFLQTLFDIRLFGPKEDKNSRR